MLHEQKEYDKAIKHFKIFLNDEPNNPKANYIIGKCYRKLKDWQNVVDTYQLFVQNDIEATPKMKKKINLDLGIACAIVGKNDLAVKLLSNLFKQDKNDAEIAFYLTMALYKMKKYKESSIIIEKAIKIAPKGKSLQKNILKLAHNIRKKLK